MSTISSGRNVCRFSIVTNRYYRDAEKNLENEVTYIDVDCWGSLTDRCAKYLRKGRGVRVVGPLKQDSCQGEDAKIRERYVVVAENVEFKPEPNKAVVPMVQETEPEDLHELA